MERHALIQQFKRSAYLELEAQHTSSQTPWASMLDTHHLIESNQFEDFITPNVTDDKGKAKPRHIKDINLIEAIKQEVFRRGQLIVKSYNQTPGKSHPAPPFTTSTLLQAASSQLGMKAEETMKAAQSLFEQGIISYHRTDSTQFAEASLKKIRDYIAQWQRSRNSTQYLSPTVNTFKSVVGAQEGHEAIRPTLLSRNPESIADGVQRALYTLIVKRTLASQMAPAEYLKTDIVLTADFAIKGVEILFRASGRVSTFDGFQAVYRDEPKANERTDLPALALGESVRVMNLEVKKQVTKPPARYTEATLVKELEKRGIGRPSTYAAILGGLHRHRYIDYETRFIFPTALGIKLVDSIVSYFQFMNYEFTAEIEEQIDKIAAQKTTYHKLVHRSNSDLITELENFKNQASSYNHIVSCPCCHNTTLVQKEAKMSGRKYWQCIHDGCEGFYPDNNGEPDLNYVPPEITSHKCPKCSSNLILSREKTPGKRYFYCSSKKPKCDFLCVGLFEGAANTWRPDYSEYEKAHTHQCPNCSKGYLKPITTKTNPRSAWICGANCSGGFLEDKNRLPDYELFNRRKAEHDALVDCPNCQDGKLKKSATKPLFYCTNNRLKGAKKCKTFFDEDMNGMPDINGSARTRNHGQGPTTVAEENTCPLCKKGDLELDMFGRKFTCSECHAALDRKSDGRPDIEGLRSLQNKTFI
ncbi:DNA topoisomerase [Vibrio mediterranei]